MRGSPYFLSSTLTPHQMCGCFSTKPQFRVQESLQTAGSFRQDFVGVPVGSTMTRTTSSVYASVTSSWNRSPMLFKKTGRGPDHSLKKFREFPGQEPNVKALLVWVSCDVAEALREGTIRRFGSGHPLRPDPARVSQLNTCIRNSRSQPDTSISLRTGPFYFAVNHACTEMFWVGHGPAYSKDKAKSCSVGIGPVATVRPRQRAITCNGRRESCRLWRCWERGMWKLRMLGAVRGFESLPLRQFPKLLRRWHGAVSSHDLPLSLEFYPNRCVVDSELLCR